MIYTDFYDSSQDKVVRYPVAGGGSGGGGHTIVTASSLPMAGRSNLQINGANLVDDENNDTTVVNIPQTTFNGRSGSVLPVAGDYNDSQIALSSTMHIGGETQTNVSQALSALGNNSGSQPVINNLINGQLSPLTKLTISDSDPLDSYIFERGELWLKYGSGNNIGTTILKSSNSLYLEKTTYADKIVLFCNNVTFNSAEPYIMNLISEIWATNTIKRGSYNPICITMSSGNICNGFITVMPKKLSLNIWSSATVISGITSCNDLTKTDASVPISDRWTNTTSGNVITGEITFYI